jgi:hypothetical protein
VGGIIRLGQKWPKLKADLNETSFAWSGSTTGQAGSNITAYYQIQAQSAGADQHECE